MYAIQKNYCLDLKTQAEIIAAISESSSQISKAIKAYSADAYEQLNSALRCKKTLDSKCKIIHDVLISAFNKISVNPDRDLYFYRGIEIVLIDGKIVFTLGESFSDCGFVSLSADINVAAQFANTCGTYAGVTAAAHQCKDNCIMRIKIPKLRAASFLPIKNVSENPTEEEILLAPQSFFAYTGQHNEYGGNNVYDYVYFPSKDEFDKVSPQAWACLKKMIKLDFQTAPNENILNFADGSQPLVSTAYASQYSQQQP